MHPNRNAEEHADWRTELAALAASLAELDSTMRAGEWEKLATQVALLQQTMRQLMTAPPARSLTTADVETLRGTLQKIGEMQTQARSRQAQIQPLLKAWRHTAADDAESP